MFKLRFPAFGQLNLRWYALVALSSVMLEVGGVQFPCAPFTGWFTVPEVASRNLVDGVRYDLKEVSTA